MLEIKIENNKQYMPFNWNFANVKPCFTRNSEALSILLIARDTFITIKGNVM